MAPPSCDMQTPIERVLDLARWAPSGDNSQPWRFEFVSPVEALIHTFDTRRHCVYDLTGAPSQIAVGALLETARIAATDFGMRAHIERLPTPSDERLRFRLRLIADPDIRRSELVECINKRCTNRRRYARRPLTPEGKAALEGSVGSGFSVHWIEGRKRWQIAWLMFQSAHIRLTIPEAYAVHRDVIEWNAQFSESKVPDRAVGLDPIGMALMRWAMKSWSRTNILSNYLGGTLLPRLQLELAPGVACAAHLLICAQSPPSSVDDYLSAGSAVQRLWLTAARLGLQMQPEMTPLIFAEYARTGLHFTVDSRARLRSQVVGERLDSILGEQLARQVVWMSRIGSAGAPRARSLRLPLSRLLQLRSTRN